MYTYASLKSAPPGGCNGRVKPADCPVRRPAGLSAGGMMSFPDVISLLTLLIVAVSLLVYGIQAFELVRQTRILAEQTRISNIITATEVTHRIVSINYRLNEILFEHPRFRSYIYGNRPLPRREPLRSQVLTLAEMYIDMMTVTFDHAPIFSPSEYDCCCRYYCDLLAGSASLRYWYQESRQWYEPHVRQILDQMISGELTSRSENFIRISIPSPSR
jgi:hypothetical protein